MDRIADCSRKVAGNIQRSKARAQRVQPDAGEFVERGLEGRRARTKGQLTIAIRRNQ